MEDAATVMDLPDSVSEQSDAPVANTEETPSQQSATDDAKPTEKKRKRGKRKEKENAAAENELHEEFDNIVESLLFSTDAPLSARKLADLAGCGTPTAVKDAIERINERFEAASLTFRIEAIAGGFQMLTIPKYHEWVRRLDKQRAQTRIGDAAMETLAIIAYRQPIIRADIEAIRGVATGEVIARLREMGVVKIAGRAEVVGRPLLYATTPKFLDVFGLSGLEDLPPMDSPIPTLAVRDDASDTRAEGPATPEDAAAATEPTSATIAPEEPNAAEPEAIDAGEQEVAEAEPEQRESEAPAEPS